ncbi:Ankyrin repeat-containing protein [Morus notabilis]|uniref:Ankyrin repeat-containing protein n=1 Tax=Morus notabilis TaxID=981085 RepID=W9SUA5_9ROSA|nr:Ankyrin repeat-containing protein [Morus notabilis]
MILHDLEVSVDERLKAAAQGGDIDKLYTLIREDPHVLDRIDETPFVDTPMHVAASFGKTEFAMETMQLKPSFARKLNQEGFTPLHLALLKKQTLMVYSLIFADSELIRVHGKEGKTPLHYAAEQGNVYLLKTFLQRCPSSIEDVTNHEDTALQIAVKNKKFDAFCLLVLRLRTAVDKGSEIREYKTLNWQNNVFDTALHIAVKTHQPEVVRVLIDNHVDLNIKNSESLTPLEILESDDSQSQSQVNNPEAREAIKERLRRARASKFLSFFRWKSSKCYLPPTVNLLERWYIDITRGKNGLAEESRNMLLVGLVLIATVGYQCVLSPPGGVWQADRNNSTTTHDNKSSSEIHHPGTVVMGNWSFLFFMLFNSLALALTTHAICFLVMKPESSWWYFNRSLLITFGPLCYLISLQTISPNNTLFARIIVIPTLVYILLPIAHARIRANLRYKTRNWPMSPSSTHGVAT